MTDAEFNAWLETLTIDGDEAYLPGERIVEVKRRPPAATEEERRERIRIQHRDSERKRRARLRAERLRRRMITNEAADRLRTLLVARTIGTLTSRAARADLGEALAAERRATVARIRERLQERFDLIGGDVSYRRSELLAWLDEEAER